MEDFETRDAKDRVRSGVGGEIGELDELLSDMAEAKRDLCSEKKDASDSKTQQGQRKIAAGKELVLQSLKNKVKRSKDSSSESDDEAVKEVAPKKRRVVPIDNSDGMKHFGEAIKQSDLARCEVERECLLLESRKFDQEVLDRVADRTDKAQEREERREEAIAQREALKQMREDSTAQMNAMLALIGKVLESKT